MDTESPQIAVAEPGLRLHVSIDLTDVADVEV